MGAVTATNAQAWHRTNGTWTAYRGLPCQQFTSDMVRYAELIAELAPPFVLEVGRAEGGTAVFLADALDMANPAGVVLSVDVEDVPVALAGIDNLRCLRCSSTDAEAVRAVWKASLDAGGRRGIVLLDGDHDAGHVALELDLYAPWADYLVVEDTIMADLGDTYARNGPHLALAQWLPEHPEFEPDPDPHPTQHPGGYLRRRTME